MLQENKSSTGRQIKDAFFFTSTAVLYFTCPFHRMSLKQPKEHMKFKPVLSSPPPQKQRGKKIYLHLTGLK